MELAHHVNNVVDAMIAVWILSLLSTGVLALKGSLSTNKTKIAKAIDIITNAKILVLVDIAMVSFNAWWLIKLVRLTSSVTHFEVMAIATFLGLGGYWFVRLIKHSIDLAVD